MKEIYRFITPRPSGWSSQDIKGTLIADQDGHRLKVVLKFDTSYAFQSSASVSHMVDGRFETLLTFTAPEIPCVASYHAMKPQDRGALERNGNAFELEISRTLGVLFGLGLKIVS